MRALPLNAEVQNIAISFMKDLGDTCCKDYHITIDGYALRIPIDPAVKVNGKLVNEIYIKKTQDNPPLIMIFDNSL